MEYEYNLKLEGWNKYSTFHLVINLGPNFGSALKYFHSIKNIVIIVIIVIIIIIIVIIIIISI